jgi:peptidoglycan/LPS O-acetylase OafA/YrhL
VPIDMPSTMVDVRHKRPPLKALTSIRFFAAMYVVFFHMQIGFTVLRVPLVAHFMASGYTGVTLFFVLSGFILAYNYPEVRSAKEFWIARFARIYPVYALSLLLSLMRPVLWHQPHFLAGCILDFGLLQAWWIPLFSAINSAAWTLSVEAFFYAMFPLLLPLLRTMRTKIFVLLQAAYLLFVCLPAILSFSRFAQQGIQLAGLIEGSFPLFRLNTFAVGVFVGTRYLAQHRESRVKQQRSKQNNVTLPAAILSSVALLCVAPSFVFLPLRTLLLTYAFIWVIVELATVAWPILTTHWMQVAGEISYGIYILQFPVGFMVDGLWRRLVSDTIDPFLPHVLAILIAAYVSFRWFETPARLTIRRVLTGRPVPVRAV